LKYQGRRVIPGLVFAWFVVPLFLLAAFLAFFTGPDVAGYTFFVLLTLGLIPAAMAASALRRREQEERFARADEGYEATLALIAKRCSELTERQQQVDTVLDRIGTVASQPLVTVREKLLAARRLTQGQFARYVIMGTEIELAQAQNRLSPLVYELDRLNFAQIDDGLKQVDQTIERLGVVSAELPAKLDHLDGSEDGAAIKTRTIETVTACQALREALIGRQALRAIQGVRPARTEAPADQLSRSSLQHLEAFNLQITITDFAASLEELEQEYQRMNVEDELDS
jgi:hypothetical protein